MIGEEKGRTPAPHLQVRCMVRLLRQLEHVIQLRRDPAGSRVLAARILRRRTAGAVTCSWTACPCVMAPLTVLLGCDATRKELLPDAGRLS